MGRQKFIVIGMDDNHQPFFAPEVLEQIHKGQLFSGGTRHHEIVSPLLPEGAEWIPVTAPLDAVFARYATLPRSVPVLVFASGDPLFFGFANTLRRRLPEAEIQLYPAFNSLQQLAHRLLLPYDDMRTVSLTGRPWNGLDRALIEHSEKIGVLTDREHTPTAIAARMLEYGYTYYIMYIGEHLGHPGQERVRRMSLQEAATESFDYPNNLILHCEKAENLPPRCFGIPDDEFAHLDGRARMITKAPIRLLSLQNLELPRRHTLWDIGFCTGSISIEARLQFPHLEIATFEIRPEGKELMAVNSRRFGAPGIQALTGDFLAQDLSALPRPDAVFIGGHGGKLKEMIARIREVLLPGGCVVFNSVTVESRTAFETAARESGLTLHPSMHIALNDYNPIDILKASLSI